MLKDLKKTELEQMISKGKHYFLFVPILHLVTLNQQKNSRE